MFRAPGVSSYEVNENPARSPAALFEALMAFALGQLRPRVRFARLL